MFKLVILSVLVTMSVAKPGHLLASPLIGKLVSEKTIESHGNTVVHASAPVVHSAPAVAYTAAVPVAPVATVPVAKAALVAEKTIESHGNAIVHSSAPLVHAAPAVATYAAAPYVAAPYASVHAGPQIIAAAVAEKTIESHGNSVVHAAAPLLHAAPLHYAAYTAPVHYSYPTAYVAEKTVSNYGHSLVHHGF